MRRTRTRRTRSVREIRKKAIEDRKAIQKNKSNEDTELQVPGIERRRILRKRRNKNRKAPNVSNSPPIESFLFKSFDEYHPSMSSFVVAHVIESLGMGGAQTMSMELMLSLDRYFGKNCKNIYVCLNKKKDQKQFQDLYKSYGIEVIQCRREDYQDLCKQYSVAVTVQHRVSLSSNIRRLLPPKMLYVLVNHTWNRRDLMRSFDTCDAYVSVCDFLHKRCRWPRVASKSRRITILNGVENVYLQDIQPDDLGGGFHTGRCHRMTGGKFDVSSLKWLSKLPIKDHYHHLMGRHDKAKKICESSKNLVYHGWVANREKKMSLIKSLDAYFYETFQSEGASVAILESLAAGVPVICRPLGGCSELVRSGVNGFVVGQRDKMGEKLLELSDHPVQLQKMKSAVLRDFENRLHVKHTACKYMQVFEALFK